MFAIGHHGQILGRDEARERIHDSLCGRDDLAALGMIAADREPRGLRIGAGRQSPRRGAEALLRQLQFALTQRGQVGQRHVDEFFRAIASGDGVTTDLPLAVGGGEYSLLEIGGVRVDGLRRDGRRAQ